MVRTLPRTSIDTLWPSLELSVVMYTGFQPHALGKGRTAGSEDQ